jgi:hypothetical protein
MDVLPMQDSLKLTHTHYLDRHRGFLANQILQMPNAGLRGIEGDVPLLEKALHKI